MPVTLVKWLYANSNPVRYTDPSGKQYDIGSCYGDEFCLTYGQAIADRAIYLIDEFEKGNISIDIGSSALDEFGQYIYFRLYNGTDTDLHYLCADLVRDIYTVAGFNLQANIITVLDPSGYQYPDAMSRNATVLQQYLVALGHNKDGDTYPYIPGEMVLLGDFHDPRPDKDTDGQAQHAGIVMHGGYDPQQIIIAQISYTTYMYEEISLYSFVNRNSRAVYGDDKYQEGYRGGALEIASEIWVNSIPFDYQAYRNVIHGHP